MKTAIILNLLIILSAGINAQPKFIGHRGSYWGVENSAEAFIAGAKKGYLYLETDVKVAKDGTFVLTHDDETNRLGGNLNITQATVEQLKAETYTQTRGGVTYTGKICTLEEYLQICKEHHAIPFIELKWATGINNNDCSNLGRMVDKVVEYGFGETAIINTSMKKCLEFVRKNYPDFRLMFLCNTNWESNFDWCVEQNIGAYIQTGCFDRNTVIRFHEKGLKVGVWTVNTPANYTIYGNYGCDLIAVDYLDTTNLPALDPFSALTPNKLDYPDHRGIVQNEYAFEKNATISVENLDIRKAAAFGKSLYLLDAEGRVTHVDLTAGTSAEIALTVSGRIADIAVTADGFLAATTIPRNGISETVLWNATKGESSLTQLRDCGGHIAFCVSGTSSEWKIYHTTAGGICGMSSKGQSVAHSFSGVTGHMTLTVSPFSRDNIIIDSPTTLPSEYIFDWENDATALKLFMSVPSDAGIDVSQSMMQAFRYGAKLYAVGYTGQGFQLFDLTDGLGKVTPTGEPFSDAKATDGAFTGGFGNVFTGNISVQAVIGSTLYNFTAPGEEPEGNIGETDFRIEKVWSMTDNEGNKPDHIDGTNAQQGTAVNGVFYINDCADRLIYVYTEDGLAGTLPGGSGWGCTRDDAGNIIVRDDKETSAAHRLLVYPAGTMPGDGTEAVSIEVTAADAGQTNFISASGDVLGDGGYVYLFPNKQTAVSLLKIADGQFAGAIRSKGLSIESSTAGYVVPVKNNPEHWLYMVRNKGIYRYNGSDEGLLLGGSATRPPMRNSTCGAEIFTLSSHEILVYNSGANYLGGFTVKDLSDLKIIKNIPVIGNRGYEEGGNYSVSNWITAEKIDAGSYYLYQYCPANGIAVYKFWDANYEPESGVVDKVETAGHLAVYPNPAVTHITAEGFEGALSIYSAAGSLLKQITAGHQGRIDVSELPSGLYLVKDAAGRIAKFIKR